MRIRANLPVIVHQIGDHRRPVGLRVAGLTVELSRGEARDLADQLHDTAEREIA